MSEKKEESKPTTESTNTDAKESKPKLDPIRNGGITDKFVWVQDIYTTSLYIDIPTNIKAKMLDVVIKKKHITVKIKGEDKPIIDGELSYNTIEKENYWQLEVEGDKRQLIITLHKDAGFWWKNVFVGDPEIDTDKIDAPTIAPDQLDSEVRQSVEKMMYDFHAEKKGLPTSKEIIQRQQLEKFKKMFPQFDFSNAKISGSGF